MVPPDSDCPTVVADYASQAVAYVERSVGLRLEYDSDTLPLLDHYLRSAADDTGAAEALVASTAGAYFGEVVRRAVGGVWDVSADDPGTWRLILPGGLSFLPARMALAAILHDETGDADASFQAPQKMWPFLEQAMERMGAVSEDDYYSLCCRLDTIEHLQTVLLAVAAEAARRADDEV